jgi:hypothetical protein
MDMLNIDDLFQTYGKSPIDQIKEFVGRFNRSATFTAGTVQLDRRISGNQAHEAIQAGLKGSLIAKAETPDSYRIIRNA